MTFGGELMPQGMGGLPGCMALKLISTDFDGTIFAEFERPPVAPVLQRVLAEAQRQGVFWVINTGRDLSSLLESLGRSQMPVHPDALVLVEREIYWRRDSQYVPDAAWNNACDLDHAGLFARVRPLLPALLDRLRRSRRATFYEDAYSPLCVIAESVDEADRIEGDLAEFALRVPGLTVVRNDVYIRFAHEGFDKGSALAEVARRLGLGVDEILAAGDHYNDIPMLDRRRARWLVAPSNGIPVIRDQVLEAGGYVSELPHAYGVAEGIEHWLKTVPAGACARPVLP